MSDKEFIGTYNECYPFERYVVKNSKKINYLFDDVLLCELFIPSTEIKPIMHEGEFVRFRCNKLNYLLIMEKVRLNHFILWCKNWYQPVDNRMDIIAQAQKILNLDDYMPCNNPISIALIFIDELVDKGVIKPIRLQVWNEEIVRYMSMYSFNYNEALLYRIKNFFAFECSKFSLTPPVYSRKVYKLGFVGPSHMGNSYKMLNHKANNFFKKYS